MKILGAIGVLAVVGAGIAWYMGRDSGLPEVRFAEARQKTLVATLPTNGKIEPIDWQAVRAESGGLVDRVLVKDGQSVIAGQLLAVLRSGDAQGDAAAADARVAGARAELDALSKGGADQELTEINNQLDRAKFDRDEAVKEIEVLKRLASRNAATRAEVDEQERRRRAAELAIASHERKRASLVSQRDRSVAEARLREAQAAADQAKRRLALAEIRSPLTGVVYSLEARAGAYLNPGDLVANVGQTGRLRVRVYVDEPELGRVAAGLPVTITWDALPAHDWKGTVERMPSQVVPLGTRQVGEVLCAIENADGRLLPGTNINAEIRTAVADNAVTVPKETVRREGADQGVFVLVERDGTASIRWQKVTAGISSTTETQIVSGLARGEWVALPGEIALADQQVVRALKDKLVP